MHLATTTATNLGFLALIGVYLGWAYPAAIAGLAVAFAVLVVAEVLLARWPSLERWAVVREAAFLGGLGMAWLVATPIYPLAAFALVASLLVLVGRQGLRLLPALAAAELLWCGMGGTSAVPAVVRPALAAACMVPLAIAALAADAWLLAQSGARRALRRPRPGWPWLIPVVVACAGLGLALGLPVAHRAPSDLPVTVLRVASPRQAASGHAGLSTVLRIGDQVRMDRDQRVAARLEWIGAPPRLPRMVYLRAICLPQVICEGPFLLWRASEDGFIPFTAAVPPRVSTAWLLRKPGGNDAVLRPDGGQGADLTHLVRDADGNWYQAGIGRQESTYRVSLEHLSDPETGIASVGEVAACRTLPRDLRSLPWERVEQASWSARMPEDAAQEIIAMIQGRCRYELENLPEPAPGPGGALATFLLAPEMDDRRGHCQYFATAAVVLLRRAGHPARTVVGFASEEFDATGVTFRGIHAHAWLEVVNSRGRWQRFDATPGAGYLMRTAGLDPALKEVPPEIAAKMLPEPASGNDGARLPFLDVPLDSSGNRWLLGGIGLGVVWALVRWWRSRPPAGERRRQQLARAEESLLACAREFGIPIRPATTVTVIADLLTQRSGVDLGPALQEHLAARYGTGPAPRPWPLADLRRALRQVQAGRGSSPGDTRRH